MAANNEQDKSTSEDYHESRNIKSMTMMLLHIGVEVVSFSEWLLYVDLVKCDTGST